MNVPLELTFRGLDKTPEIEALIRTHAEKLEKACSYVSSCRVVVERDQRHQRVGRPFRVRLDITVPPGKEFAVRRESTEGEMHEPLSKVIIEAFKAAARRLKKTAALRRELKPPLQSTLQGTVSRIFSEDQYGFISTPEGEDVYFHASGVANGDFDRLQEGADVTFTASFGESGLRANAVRIEESASREPEEAKE
jgi:cold shock CspA family protein